MGIRESILDDGQRACWVIRGAFRGESLAHWMEFIPWQQNSIRIYGKTHLEPRLTAWMGPAYRYSSIQWPAVPFTSGVREFVTEVESHTQTAGYFNACLFNQYRNGQDSMGWHRDNEPEIDPACIASVSFGASRDFAIRHRSTREKWSVTLHHGDVLVMEHLQDDYEHSLPKRLRVGDPRVNLTLRQICTSNDPSEGRKGGIPTSTQG
ncbi:MAG TPA: alpha-ketoglutarate-dependent dioxygenase AlkB [Flavobacteriales bacterium]|jgi:alkylated DNA repair dioxygenase AlkB|nr:alpha-ketoglutarate-dependent dioxygenase AlkB [Flavobacteriales bacterium]